MRSRRALLATTLALLLVASSGCSGLLGGGNADAIVDRATESMQDVESYEFDMSMTLTSDQSDQEISLDASGAVDAANEKMRMQMSFLGQDITQYIIGDTQYIHTQGTWQQQNIADQNIWQQGPQLGQQQQILNNASVTLEGNTTIEGQEVFELKVDVSEEQVMEIIEQNQGSSLSSQVSLDDITYTMYVTHGDYRLKRIEATMAMSSQGQNIDADLSMTFRNYNGDFDIQLPAEAENAQSMG